MESLKKKLPLIIIILIAILYLLMFIFGWNIIFPPTKDVFQRAEMVNISPAFFIPQSPILLLTEFIIFANIETSQIRR